MRAQVHAIAPAVVSSLVLHPVRGPRVLKRVPRLHLANIVYVGYERGRFYFIPTDSTSLMQVWSRACQGFTGR